jgi:hypothetical protein
MDDRRLAELSEMAEASDDVALQLESEIALSGAYDAEMRLAEMDAHADAVLGRRAFQEDEAAPQADLAALAEDAGF